MAQKQWVDITANALYGTYDAYIRYANQLFNIKEKTDTPTENGLRAYQIKGNTHYKVQILMQARFRLACTNNMTTGQTVTNYIFDSLDVNGSNNVGAVRELEITSNDGEIYLIVGAWANSCTTGLNCVDTLDSIVVYEEQEISNTVTSIEITALPMKTDYLLGEALNTDGLVVTASYQDGSSQEVTDYILSEFNADIVGAQKITVTYCEQTAVFEITVHQVTEITVIPPTKLIYNFGEPLDTDGMIVSVICEDEYSVAITDYTILGYNPTIVGEQTITVAYKSYTKTFSVTVISTITGIEITTLPTKVIYKQGEIFDATGLVISAIMQDGSKIEVTDYTLTGFDSTILGQQTITAEYQYTTADFTVTIVQNLLTATCGTPTLANVTAALDVFTGVLTFSGAGAIKSYSYSTAPFINNISDVKSVVIEEGITNLGNYLFYKNANLKSVSLPSTVKTIGTYVFCDCSALTEITNTDKITYLSSYSFSGCTALKSLSFGSDISGIVTTAFNKCTNLTSIFVNVEYELISGSPWGAVNAVITWGTYPLANLELLTPPNKTEYLYGESLDKTGTTVRLYYTDGSSRDIDTVSDLTFSGYSSTKVGEQIVTITYRTVSTNITVNVVNYTMGIYVFSPPNKTSYELGEPQDNTGLTVFLYYADGSEEEITDYTVSPIDYEIYGKQEITVSYKEYTDIFYIDGNFPARLFTLLGQTNNMNIIRNSKNDDATDEFLGVDWFLFNAVTASNVYVNGNSWLGFGTSDNHLNVCNRDGAVWRVRRLEQILSNGHKFLKFEVEGYTHFLSSLATHRLVYEVYLFDDNSIFLNIITVPTATDYLGESYLKCNDVKTTFSVIENTPTMVSFYPTNEQATMWEVEQVAHKYLLTGIEISSPAQKIAYRYGEQLDLTGLEVILLSELEKTIVSEFHTVSGYDPLTAGTQTILISYRDFQTSYEVTVTDGFTVRFVYYDNNLNELVVMKTETVNYGHDATPPTDTSKSGYIFAGWASSYKNITWDTDIYANYLPKNICTVIFADYDGRLLKKQYVARGDSAVPPNIPTREGYVFFGWDKAYDYVVTDMTVTAVYAERTDKFTVTFLDYDGNTLKSQQVGYGGSANAPIPPEKTGYFFLAWSNSYEYVTADITTQAIYRSNRLRTAVEFYNGNNKAGELRMAIDCYIEQKLNGECTIELTTLESHAAFVQKQFHIEFDGLIFTLSDIEKKTQNGTYLTTLKGEHISCILNDEDYDIEEFFFTGSPKTCLAKILQGTPFSVGTVDFANSITLKVNQQSTRRDVLMQLIALCGGEIEYDKYKIGIREHIGNTMPTDLMDTKNVTNVEMSYNAVENTETYSIELSKQTDLSLGDEIHIVFTPLAIHKTKRIVGIKRNPFNYRKISITVGGYRACISDSLYQIANNTDKLQEQIDELSSDLDAIEDTLDNIGNSMGGFNVMSVKELPANPDMNTIYLIQGTVKVS